MRLEIAESTGGSTSWGRGIAIGATVGATESTVRTSGARSFSGLRVPTSASSFASSASSPEESLPKRRPRGTLSDVTAAASVGVGGVSCGPASTRSGGKSESARLRGVRACSLPVGTGGLGSVFSRLSPLTLRWLRAGDRARRGEVPTTSFWTSSRSAMRSSFPTFSNGSFENDTFGESIGRGDTTSPPVGNGESVRFGRVCICGEDAWLEVA